MPANRNQLQTALHKSYNRLLFAKEVLSPIFGAGFSLYANDVTANEQPNKSEAKVIDKVAIYGNIILEDNTEITCYEILLKPNVRIEHSKVAIQQYVRKLLTVGQAALINFIPTRLDKNDITANTWRLTFVAKDSLITDDGIKEKHTNAKRYTYLLGPSETCKTAAERFEVLSTAKKIDFEALVNAFSVERLSKAFFDEYTLHYQNFIEHLTTDTKYLKTVFKGDDKTARDFVKKLMGRIVFLYFVQKKGWLGASTKEYKDGDPNFIMNLFKKSGLNETFYPNWLSPLFFETLNKQRTNDIAPPPLDKANLGLLPFLNGGLFDKEPHDDSIITFKPSLFHNTDVEDVILTEKNKKHSRGFLDFLNAFNFTVHEDSPDDSTVAVDPEMLGHIFENLLEDNKDKGTFYTPKEIVHYMCQESLTEYLITHLSKEYTVYRQLDKQQVELFGNEARTGQLLMMEQLGSKALNRADVEQIVKHKNISQLTKQQLKTVNELLTTVKICDPAIGSGAFPMGLLQEIMAIKELVHYSLNEQFSSPSPNGEGWGEAWQPATVKENIIQKSIYGVDIEKGAVDIARLRFWLSIVVDEDLPKPLPNLDYKIVVGNSLLSKFDDEIINIDWNIKVKNISALDKITTDQVVKIHLLQSKQELYFKAIGNKTKLKKEIELLKAQVLINQLTITKISFEHNNPKQGGFAPTAKEILKNTNNQLTLSGYNKTIKKLENFTGDEALDFFDWKLNFPEVLNDKITKDIGFDIVIGNPPYVQIKQIPEVDKPFYIAKYKFATGRFNLFYFFVELSKHLSITDGLISYIIPDRILLNTQCIEIRNWLLNNQTLIEIDSFDESVFENAVVDSIILTYKNKPNTSKEIFARPFLKIAELRDNTAKILLPLSHFEKSPNKQFDLNYDILTSNLIDLIRKDSKMLGEVSETKDGIIQSKIGDLLFLPKKQNQFCKKLLFGKDVNKYELTYNENWVNYQPDKMMELELERGGGGLRLRNKSIFEKTKILTRQTSDCIVGTLDLDKFYYSNTLHGTSITNIEFDIKFILGLLNSKLLNYYYKTTTAEGGKVFAQVKIEILRQLPIKKAENQKTYSTIVDYILFLKSQELATVSQQLMPTYFEQIIDGMVYELYFPELLKKHNREIIQHLGELPAFTDTTSEDKKMSICTQVFNRLNQKEHPVRVNLFYMNSIPEIAIIEGKQ